MQKSVSSTFFAKIFLVDLRNRIFCYKIIKCSILISRFSDVQLFLRFNNLNYTQLRVKYTIRSHATRTCHIHYCISWYERWRTIPRIINWYLF